MQTERSHGERLAILEYVVPQLRADVAEIKADVKSLLAAHNRQSGAVRLATLLWGGFCAGLALMGDYLIQSLRGHP